MKSDCHEHAVRCALQSFHARNEDERELYMKMALLWLELAKVEVNRHNPHSGRMGMETPAWLGA